MTWHFHLYLIVVLISNAWFPPWLQQNIEEEEQVPVGARVVAGQSVYQQESPPTEEQDHGGRVPEMEIEGEDKEDLPDQPPPIKEKPKESKNTWE